jgi:arginine:ornithine antiporter/lysine permease
MPAWLGRQNAQGVPAHAMWITSALVQAFLLLTLFSKASYLALISLSTAMILVPYLLSALYALSVAWQGRINTMATSAGTAKDVPVAALASVFCLWLLYAAGLKYLLLSALLYAPGAIVFVMARREQKVMALTNSERLILGALIVLALVAAAMLYAGKLTL